MKIERYIGILAVLAVCAGCAQKGPQRPSQRMGQSPDPDSAALALLELNQQLAQAADEELYHIVQSLDEPYALYDSNVWMRIVDKGDEDSPTPRSGEYREVHMRVYNLDGKLLEDTDGTYRILRHELPPGVDVNLLDLHRGAKARMYAPWYAAYGLQGTAHIPPYENVIIDIELK